MSGDLQAKLAGLSPEKRALLERRLRENAAASGARATQEPLAIIGIGCRLPGGISDPESLWRALADGVDAVTEVPADRWDAEALFDPDASAPGKAATRWGGFLENVDAFDATLFGIAPREAAQMDPQQRVLLETAWDALEHAGQAADRLRGSQTGVFVGVHSHSIDYCLLQYESPDQLDAFSGTGTAHNFLSGRLSYMLDLHGPSLAIDTACSSSLVAVHLACQSLWRGESTMALAAGVNLMLTPTFTVVASRMHMMSPDGRCKAFDAGANGFVRSEGCGVVVIKPLSRAAADGDRVLAVIRGTAVNQDGHTNGITAPNGLSQQKVIRAALHNAGVDPADVGYVETHGTGTPLGDPIEVEALTAVLGAPRPSGSPVILGSIKSNIGHTEGAAGVAGLIKAVLCLDRRQTVPVVHFTSLNPHMSLAGTALTVPTTLAPWESRGGRRIAGVSSFGWSGTNAHIVLEEAPPAKAAVSAADGRLRLLPISARSPEALVAQARAWRDWWASAPEVAPADACDTAAWRRAHHEVRGAVVGVAGEDFGPLLDAIARGESAPGATTGRVAADSGIVFVFPGQGSQWIGMGRRLFEDEAVFREAIEQCDRAFGAFVDWSVVEMLRTDPPPARVHEIDVVQPTLFAVEVALAALWRSWGIVPDAVVGHSMGEVAAAHVAGALSIEDAARVICLRSRLLRRISGQGAMAVVELSLDETRDAIAGYEATLAIAVSNSPGSTVISGDPSSVESVMAALEQRDVFCRAIKVDVASHSPQVDQLRDDLLSALAPVRPMVASVPIYSTVTAGVEAGDRFDAAYWARNLREPVLLSSAVRQLAADGNTTFIEMSPHPILLPAIESGLAAIGSDAIVLPSMRRDEDERAVLLASLARLYVRGCEVTWRVVNGPGAFVDVPGYSYQRERFWLSRRSERSTSRQRVGHPLLGRAVQVGAARAWEAVFDAAGLPAPESYVFDGRAVVAPGLSIEAAVEAAAVCGVSGVAYLEFVRPCIRTGSDSSGRAEVRPAARGAFAFTLQSQNAADLSTTHAVATLGGPAAPLAHADSGPTDAEPPVTCLSAEQAYARLGDGGWHVDGPQRILRDVRLSARGLQARFELPAGARHAAFHLPPALWQAALDAAAIAAGAAVADPRPGDAFVPLRIAWVSPVGSQASSGSIVVRMRSETGARADVVVTDADGVHVVTMAGVELDRRAVDARSVVAQDLDDWLFEIDWEPAPVPAASPAAPASWLVLADRASVADALEQAVSAAGDQVTVIRPGADDDGRAVDTWLATAPSPLGHIVDLRGVDATSVDEATLESLEAGLQLATGRALRTVQAAVRAVEAGRDLRVWIVTRGAQPVGGQIGPEGPIQAAVWGLGRVVAEEHPELWGGLVDLDPDASTAAAAQALFEHLRASDGERQVAFRGAERYGARLSRLSVRDGAVVDVALRPDASYLITGGFTGVGAAAAMWLAGRGARHLVLAGRTSLPPRDTWASVDASSALGRRIAVVQELEALGADVRVEAIDIADEAAVGAFWQRFEAEQRPAIRGILHAAVVIEDGLLRDLDPSTFTTVMRPKASGAWLLQRLAEPSGLDFFVLFSSLGAVIGQTGQGNYAAANAFLDAFAHLGRVRGVPAISVNWAGWREAGLGASAPGARQTIHALESEGISSYTTAQGLDVLARVLAHAPAQAVVIPMNRARFAQSHWAAADPAWVSRLVGGREAVRSAVVETQSIRTQLAALPIAGRRAFLEQFLAEQLAHVLRLPVSRIDPAVPMGGLGLESLMALELRNRLEARVGLKLSATIIWNHPTVSALARFLAGRMDVAIDPTEESEAAPTAATTAAVPADLDAMSDLEALEALSARPDERPR